MRLDQVGRLGLLAGEASAWAFGERATNERRAKDAEPVYQGHEYLFDWEGWPDYYIEDPQVAVCYRRTLTDFETCVNACAGMSGRQANPTNVNCSMIVTNPLFDDLPNFLWTPLANNTVANETYELIFVLQSEDRAKREVFKAGPLPFKAFDQDLVPLNSPTHYVIDAQIVEQELPTEVATTRGSQPYVTGPSETAATTTPIVVSSSGNPDTGAIIGAVLGSVGGSAFVALVALIIWRRKRHSERRPSAKPSALPSRPGTQETFHKECVLSEAAGSHGGAELGDTPRAELWNGPVAELDGSQAAELAAAARMSQYGMSQDEKVRHSRNISVRTGYPTSDSESRTIDTTTTLPVSPESPILPPLKS